jgi:hypothetical protein
MLKQIDDDLARLRRDEYRTEQLRFDRRLVELQQPGGATGV